MRDLRKIRSKYEFKLDNKQIAFLLVGLLVVLVVVFALGVVVGKGLVQIQNIEAGMNLQDQVEQNVPDVLDFDLDVEPAAPTPDEAAVPDPEGYINILDGTTPTPTDAVEPPALTPVPAPTPEPLPAPPTGGSFTIQLSSHPLEAEANQKRTQYTDKGLTNVYIVTAQVKGQTWYRVRVGAFETKQGAEAFAKAIKAKGIVANPWVTLK